MQLHEATGLINAARLSSLPQHWADLGCGSGTFTMALAGILPAGSTIDAIDKSGTALPQIPSVYHDVTIKTVKADFVTDRLPLTNLDGIIMANALHYMSDKTALIAQLRAYLKPQHHFIIVEYNTSSPNRWVPYPIPFASLRELFVRCGYASVEQLREMPSIYRAGGIYAALVT